MCNSPAQRAGQTGAAGVTGVSAGRPQVPLFPGDRRYRRRACRIAAGNGELRWLVQIRCMSERRCAIVARKWVTLVCLVSERERERGESGAWVF